MSTYREWQSSLHPTSLAGRWGSAWGAALGAEKDRILGLAREAVTVRGLPEGDRAALDAGGADRGIPRLAGEGLDSYRDRLRGAWESWSWAGTPRGIRETLLLGALGGSTLYTDRVLPRPPSPSLWARYTVVFSGRVTWDAETAWDTPGVDWDGTYKAGVGDLDPEDARSQLYGILRTWSNARDCVTSVIIARAAYLWDTSETWDSPVNWDDGEAPTELAARDWDDTASAWDAPRDGWDFFC